ncbi:WD domain protein [Extremus antarcticus]|uniref:Mitochondrial division protein 1 n=1 Tax=Extremus antarcticus TaxID=702011 RepID=A0AAJ0DF56_9PEZI|nr:WD domain protein [Extremus antarcticus]
MSLSTTPADTPDRRPSPKRKHSDSTSYHNGEQTDPGAKLQFAYDEPSDNDDTFHTPASNALSPNANGDDNSSTSKRQKTSPTRPLTLNYTPHLTLHSHRRGIASVKISPNGHLIASASADGTIKLWSSTTGALQHTLEGHLAGVNTITWSPDSLTLASGSDDKTIRLWDVKSGKCLSTALASHHNYVYSLAFAPKGNMLVSGSYDEAVFLWDVRTARLMRSLPAHSDPVSGVDFVRDGTLIASCSSDGLIRIWDTGTGQCLKTLVHEDNAAVTSVKFSPNGRYVLAATLDSCVRLWDYVEGRVVKTYLGHKNVRYSANACFGTYAAEDATKRSEGQELGEERRDEPNGEPDSGAATPNDEGEGTEKKHPYAFITIGSEDGTIVLWDVSSKEMLQRLSGHSGAVLAVDVGMEDQTIVSGGLDGCVRVWRRGAVEMGDGDGVQESNGNADVAVKGEVEGVRNGNGEMPVLGAESTGGAVGGDEMEHAMAMVLEVR